MIWGQQCISKDFCVDPSCAEAGESCCLLRVALPYKISTLLYCFDADDRVLLMERTREPNRGRWSPCGGKLMTEIGESPYACAIREAEEEIGLKLGVGELEVGS